VTDITTVSPFPYWTGTSTLDLIDAADEYEQLLAHGSGLSAGDDEWLRGVCENLRTEIARRQNEHWHPGSIRHSHPSGQEPHDHQEHP
jgi:hypothetical protein